MGKGTKKTMSLQEYQEGLKIASECPSVYALIQAAMRVADSRNLQLLKSGWPEIWLELRARYNAPGGRVLGEME